MADQTLEIQIKTLAELSAIKATVKELTTLKKVSNDTQKEVSGIFSSFTSSLSGIPGKLGAITAGYVSLSAAISFGRDSLSEAIEAEKALNTLTLSLKRTGEATNVNIKLLQEFASNLQDVTIFGDDLILSQITVAKNFGLTTQQAKELVKTATELASLTGSDLPTATDELIKTLSGQLPKNLKELGLEFSNLTEEQLKSGAVQDLINKKFSGAAIEATKTLSGSIAQLKERYADLQQGFGEFLVKTLGLPGALRGITFALKRITSEETEVQKLTKEIKSITKELGELQKAAQNPLAFPEKGSPRQIAEELRLLTERLPKAKEELASFRKEIEKPTSAPKLFSIDEGEKLKFLDDLKKVGLSATQIAKQERDARLKELNKIFGDEVQRNNLSVNDKKAALDAKLRIEREYSNKIIQSQKEQTAKEAQELKIRQDIFKNAASNIGLAFVNIFKGKAGPQEIQGALAGIGQQVTQGAQGTRNLLGSAAQAGGNLIAPGLGDVAGPIITELAKGKEAAKAFVTEFLNAIPEMISGLVEGIISAALTFVEQVPVIVDKIISDLPRLISAVIDSLPQIIIEFQNLMPQVAVTFASSLIEQAPNIAQAIIKSIANTPGNAVKSAGRIFKFADGGQGFAKSVPGGFGSGSTERFPAILGSGELVVDRSTAFKLKDFLNNKQAQSTSGEKSSNDSLMAALNRPIIVQIDGREVARATRNQIKSGFVLA